MKQDRTSNLSLIASLSLLKCNWDSYSRDFLQVFLPVVAESIRLSEHDVVSLENTQQSIREHFGLEFPQNVLRTLLKRAERKGYLQNDRGVYRKNHRKLDSMKFRETCESVVVAHEQVVARFAEFCAITSFPW